MKLPSNFALMQLPGLTSSVLAAFTNRETLGFRLYFLNL